MKTLKDILYKVAIDAVIGSTELFINSIHFDSRKISFNDVFVAINGTVSNGHDYIEKAINQGAVAVICEEFPDKIVNGVAYIKVKDTNGALANLANNYFDNPSSKVQLIGITGTNGKTTVASLLYQLFKKAGYKVGLLSTVKILVDNNEYKATHTTPDSLTINHYLNEMVLVGCTYCFMEVSSHGIHQKRIQGLQFRGGVFTNLSHDHLDYHKSFAAYRDVKKSFFDGLSKGSFALTNVDDKNGNVMLQNTLAKKCTYALKSYADYQAQILESQLTGLLLKVNENEVWVKLIGHFNAYNLLAIYGVAVELGIDKLEALRLLSELESVAGRFQFYISNSKITAVVDYAHTPDALENVLQTITAIRTKNEQLITVVGCGGDRDKEKRPIMAEVASRMSDKVVFTSDNPRSEDAEDIIHEMEKGVEPQNYKKTVSIVDREQAIKSACLMANENDIILIAGKGHENYQEINGVRHDFDDLQVVTKFLTQLNK
ncbi:MAG TPA: UDP-N-acetylmuramoyl-L-alanyl-D-glutamate--2,6-diaminopimelate ligase [Flavobacterium sp.]|nr:UDP-N-acetylmuramoyl-L-alanyl-D-glutamate--2,6-diaminopimelate ligase [Flavobacterium sp.]